MAELNSGGYRRTDSTTRKIYAHLCVWTHRRNGALMQLCWSRKLSRWLQLRPVTCDSQFCMLQESINFGRLKKIRNLHWYVVMIMWLRSVICLCPSARKFEGGAKSGPKSWVVRESFSSVITLPDVCTPISNTTWRWGGLLPKLNESTQLLSYQKWLIRLLHIEPKKGRPLPIYKTFYFFCPKK